MEHKWGFSAARQGFYLFEHMDDYVSAGSWPGDIVAVSDNDHDEFSGGIPAHKLLAVDDDGEMSCVDAEDADELQIQEILSSNTSTFNRLVAVAANSIAVIQASTAAGNPRENDTENLLALQQYLDALRDVDLILPDPAWPPIPEFMN